MAKDHTTIEELQQMMHEWHSSKRYRYFFRFYLPVYRFITSIPFYIRKGPKILYERARYGVSWYDAYDFDSHLAKVLHHGLTILGEHGSSHPTDYDSQKQWREDLLRCADVFGRYEDVGRSMGEEENEYEQELHEALAFVNDKFETLWN